MAFSCTGGSWRAQFDGYRWAAYSGVPREPEHGGTRVISLESSTRPMTETFGNIREEAAAHKPVIDAFHQAWYASRNTHGMTFYEGIPILKCPLDLWVYQEILWDLQPTLIIETGTAYGGSALFFAHRMDRAGVGQVLSIDLEPADKLPQHPRITYVRGFSSTLDTVVEAVSNIAADHPRVMVVLDSDHSKRHVLAELEAYADLVTPNQFLVVEDTNINGRPVPTDWKGGPGPGPAVDAWLPAHPEFEVAVLAERYMLTHNPGGWLRRTR